MNPSTVAFISGIVALAISFVVSKIEESSKNKKGKKSKIPPLYITLIGGIIAVGLSYVSQKIDEQDSEDDKNQMLGKTDSLRTELNKKNEALLAKSDSLNSKSTELVRRADVAKKQSDTIAKLAVEQKDLATKLVVKTDTVASLYRKLYESNQRFQDYVTGANSFCYFKVVLVKDEDVAILDIIHKGENPIRGVKAVILDSDGIYEGGNPNLIKYGADLRRYSSTINIGDVSLKSHGSVTYSIKNSLKYKLGSRKHIWLSVCFSSDNAEWYQRIYINNAIQSANILQSKNVQRTNYSYSKIYKINKKDNLKPDQNGKPKETLLMNISNGLDERFKNSKEYIPDWNLLYLHYDCENGTIRCNETIFSDAPVITN